MDASLYQPLFLWVTTLLSLATALVCISQKRSLPIANVDKITDTGAVYVLIAVGIIYSLWIGGRPISAKYFADTLAYAEDYEGFDPLLSKISMEGEWVWQLIMYLCVSLRLDVHDWFAIIDFIYYFSVFAGVCILTPRNPWIAMLFVLTSLSFFSFGVNGLRNGVACHLIVLAIALAFRDKYIPAAIIAFLAFGIHHSVLLPIVAAVGGILFWRWSRILQFALIFWVLSIGISLVAGDQVTAFFASLGFDDRMSGYAVHADAEGFSHVGFRWDFLLYSAMPVLMIWYVGMKRKLADNWFTVLAVIYCFCNAFWIMVIRSSFSNRFAYLSWFIYPLILAYPLLQLRVWPDQQRKTGLILLANSGFTMVMETFYWS